MAPKRRPTVIRSTEQVNEDRNEDSAAPLKTSAAAEKVPQSCKSRREDDSDSHSDDDEDDSSELPIDLTDKNLPGTSGCGKPPGSRRNTSGICPDKCAICGDRSSGHHYDVPSCNGCKIFFRRIILSQKKYYCSRGRKCLEMMPKEQRLMCRSCRYDRCVEAGMNPLAIMTSVDLSENVLVKKLLAKRKQTFVAQEDPAIKMQVERQLPLVEDFMQRLLQTLQYMEMKHELVRRSEFCPRASSGLSLEDYLNRPSSLGVPQKEAEGWPLPSDAVGPSLQMPIEFHIRNRVPFNPPSYDNLPSNRKEWLYVDVVYAIDYIKTFDFFHKLSHSDKTHLVRYVTSFCSCATSSFFSASQGFDVMCYPDGRTPYIKHEQATKMKNTWHVIKRMAELGLDRNEYVFLKAILVCDPGAPNISDATRVILQEEREKYAKSLMSYQLTKHGTKKAPLVYVECMELVQTVQQEVTKAREINLLCVALKLKTRSRLAQDVDSLA